MKRHLRWLWLAPLLFGFTLSSYSVIQTPRVRWDTWHQGTGYTTAVTEDQAFSNSFVNDGFFNTGGSGRYRADGIKCTWAVDGVGAGNMIVDIYHEDAGVDCQVTIGACTDGPNVELSAVCPAVFHTLEGSTYNVKVDTTSSCATSEPAQWHCTVDFFR